MNDASSDPAPDTLGKSPNPADTLLGELSRLVPSAFSEGRLDVAALKRALGEHPAIESGERYRLEWAGKTDAYKVLQTPTTATLRPQRELSVNFDSAEHVFIEGENLEVLKVLQKSYFGKVKLIYIDPPYNTGSDAFVYPDRFQESKEDYLRRINELDDDGSLMREGAFRKNSKENGHYHSNWLNMMLPRLYIARNLLRDDGVIFVSCDDNEVHNLRCLMNEIFGEENFVANIVWQKRYVSNVTAKYFSDMHDHILVYTRNLDAFSVNLVRRNEDQLADYKNPDEDSRGPWRAQDLSASKPYQAGLFSITTPTGMVVNPPPGRFWRCSKPQYETWLSDNRITFGSSGQGRPMLKAFLSEVQQGLTPNTWWDHKFAGHNKEATLEVKELFEGSAPFDTPKPVRLISRILESASSSEALVMDFFAGSGTTAEAVIRANKKDQGKRRFISIQLPERCGEESLAKSLGYEAISDIHRERVLRVIASLRLERNLLDDKTLIGLKCYQLAPSNFKQWRGDGIETAEELAKQIAMFADSQKPGAQTEAILHELLLRYGQELTTPIETLSVEGQRVFAIDARRMLFVLDGFQEAMTPALLAFKPREIVALESAFAGDDPLRTNFALHCRDAKVRLSCL